VRVFFLRPLALFVDIADGHNLRILIPKQLFDIVDTLAARADDGDIELVAWRGVAAAAQYISRQNRKGCRAGQKISS